MDLRLTTEAFARLCLTQSRSLGAVPRAPSQHRHLHLPSTPYRQRTSAQRWTQQRRITQSSWRQAPGAGAAAARAPSTEEPNMSALPNNVLRQGTPARAVEAPVDDIASFVDKPFGSDSRSSDRSPRSRGAQMRDFGRGPRRDFGQGTRSTAQATEPLRMRPSESPFGPSTSRNKYFGRASPPEENMVDRFEAAMRRDPLVQGRTESAAGLISQFQTMPRSMLSDQAERDALTDMILTPSQPPPPKQLPRSSLRLGSSVGRSIAIDPTRGMDVSRGLRMLDMRLAANRVRTDINKQRFYERPGRKRKRLKSLRWRARFKAGFRSVVARVRYLTKQGW